MRISNVFRRPTDLPLKKLCFLLLKLAVVAIVAWFVRGTILRAWQEIHAIEWQLKLGWLAAAAGFYLLALMPAGLFWYYLLRLLGQEVGLWESLRAYTIGHLGKYVPGKAMVVIIRAGLIRGKGVDTGVAAASVFFETLTMMAVGAFLAAACLAGTFREEPFYLWGTVGMMLMAGLPTLPPVFRFLARLLGVGKSDAAISARFDRVGFGSLAVGWGAMSGCWLLMAMSLWAVCRSVSAEQIAPAGQLCNLLAAVALATVAGFLSFVPGGLGVRDLMLAQLLDRLLVLGAAEATVASGLLRIVWLLAELGISGMLYLPVRRIAASLRAEGKR